MKISNLFNQSVDSSRQNRSQEVSKQQAEEVTRQTRTGKKGEDSVSISPLARQLSDIRKVLTEDEIAQQAKVENIKAQLEAGTYSVNSEDVANSMVSFAADSEQIVEI